MTASLYSQRRLDTWGEDNYSVGMLLIAHRSISRVSQPSGQTSLCPALCLPRNLVKELLRPAAQGDRTKPLPT